MKSWLIIADIDGTLITNTINFPELKRSIAEQLAIAGVVVRNPMSHVLSELVSYAPTESMRSKLWAQIETVEKQAAETSTQIEPVVKWITKARSVASIVGLTNNSRVNLQPVMKRLGLLEVLDDIRYREDVEGLKPNPIGVIGIMNNQTSSKDRTVLLGDSWVDAETACRAGIKFISVHNNLDRFKEHELLDITVLDTSKSVSNMLEYARIPVRQT